MRENTDQNNSEYEVALKKKKTLHYYGKCYFETFSKVLQDRLQSLDFHGFD